MTPFLDRAARRPCPGAHSACTALPHPRPQTPPCRRARRGFVTAQQRQGPGEAAWDPPSRAPCPVTPSTRRGAPRDSVKGQARGGTGHARGRGRLCPCDAERQGRGQAGTHVPPPASRCSVFAGRDGGVRAGTRPRPHRCVCPAQRPAVAAAASPCRALPRWGGGSGSGWREGPPGTREPCREGPCAPRGPRGGGPGAVARRWAGAVLTCARRQLLARPGRRPRAQDAARGRRCHPRSVSPRGCHAHPVSRRVPQAAGAHPSRWGRPSLGQRQPFRAKALPPELGNERFGHARPEHRSRGHVGVPAAARQPPGRAPGSGRPAAAHLRLHHARPLVPQVLQGGGDVDLFSACNRQTAASDTGGRGRRHPARLPFRPTAERLPAPSPPRAGRRAAPPPLLPEGRGPHPHRRASGSGSRGSVCGFGAFSRTF